MIKLILPNLVLGKKLQLIINIIRGKPNENR